MMICLGRGCLVSRPDDRKVLVADDREVFRVCPGGPGGSDERMMRSATLTMAILSAVFPSVGWWWKLVWEVKKQLMRACFGGVRDKRGIRRGVVIWGEGVGNGVF